MAIGALQTEWLSSLASRSHIRAGAAVLDLGTQDIWATPKPLARVARRHLGPEDCARTMAAIFDRQTPRRRSQLDFYSIFGAGSYRSIDLCDPRADFALDLNLPVPADIGVYDLVTNFGTTEHVFDIARTFANIHALLKVGGIQLHTLPAYGAIDHGFFNIHPSVYLDMARSNAYEIVDMFYVDNVYVRMVGVLHDTPFDFGTLPIHRRDMDDTHALMRKTALLFQQNLQSAETLRALTLARRKRSLRSVLMGKQEPLQIFLVFDMMFVALRKTSASPNEFVTPTQGVYADARPEAKKSFWRSLVSRI